MSSSFIRYIYCDQGYIYCDQVPTWNSSWLQSTHVSDGAVSQTLPVCASWAWGSLQLQMLLGDKDIPWATSLEPCGHSCVQTWIIMNTGCAPGRTDLCFRFVLPRNICASQELGNEVVSTLAFPDLWMFLLLDLCCFEINQVYEFV